MKPASDRFAFGMLTPTYPRSDRQLPGTGTQPGLDRFRDGLHDMTELGPLDELPGRPMGYDPIQSSEAELMDTVAHLQLDIEVLKCGQLGHWLLGRLHRFGVNR